MNILNKKPIILFNQDDFEQDEPGQLILLGILWLNGRDIVVEGSLNEYLDRIQWEIDDLGTIIINSEGIVVQADFILDKSELEKLILC